jgi:hypothetical protein
MEAADRALFEETVRTALAASGSRADAVLANLGWLDVLESEPRDAVEVVFHALGATGRTAGILDDVVAQALRVSPRADLAVVLPRFGTWTPPGRVEGDRVEAAGPATSRAATARDFLVVCEARSQLAVLAVPRSAVEVRAVQGIDPDAGFHAVQVQHGATAGTPLTADAWEAAVAAGRRAVGGQIAGATRAMIGLARAHALERVQFGRPIASFQAVRHRLAEALVAVEALDATLGAAHDDPGETTAALAKATAGRTARTVAAHCQQVLGGIGFTTDHPFHRFLKRTMLLEGLFGSSDDIALHLGRRLLRERRVPTVIEL